MIDPRFYEVPQPLSASDIASLPARETTSKVERDKNGNIKTTTQTERDA